MIKRAKYNKAKTINFIATKYKNKPVNIRFYTKKGEMVSFTTKQKTPVK